MRLWIAVAIVLVGCGGTPAHPTTGAAGAVAPGSAEHRLPQKSADVHVVIDGKKIAINGVTVTAKPTLADIHAIFGKPDRTWDEGGANLVHTWDTIGLLVYEPYNEEGTGDGRCISATFPYKPMSSSFSPKTMFSGTIQLDGKSFDPTLELDTVVKWPGATQPYTKASIVFDRTDFHVFTIEEKKEGHLDLVELSFWQNARNEKTVRKTPLEEECTVADPTRCSSRALAYQTGVAGRTNFEQAFQLAKLACTGGDVFGCVMLGNMHDAGRGTPQSKPEATVAWKRACTLGYKPACELAK